MRGSGRAFRWFGSRLWLLEVAAAVAALGVPALASNWSAEFGSTQSLIFDDNVDLDRTHRDAVLTSSKSVNLNLLAKAKTYKIEIAPVLGVQKTFFSQETDDWSYFPSLTLALSKSSKLTTYDLVASFSMHEVSANELVDGFVSVEEGDQLSYAISSAITRKVNERNSLIWANSANLVDYTDPSDDLVPFISLRTSGTWRRDITDLVASNVTLSMEYFDPDSATQHSRLLYRSTAGLNARLSKRLSVSGALGAVLLDPDDGGLTADVIFNVSADYKLKDTSYSLVAARDLSPTQDGDLADRYSSRFSISHQVNDAMTFGVFAAYSFQNDSDDNESSALTISPSISYQLSEDWSSSVSYRYIETDEDDQKAHSNAVTLNLSYGTFLLP